MNIKKKIREDAMNKIDEALGEKPESVTRKKRHILPKVLIPLGAAALVAGVIVGGIAIGKMNVSPIDEFSKRNPYLVKARESREAHGLVISKKSADIYSNFVLSSALKVLSDADTSMSYSPFDAFVNFAAIAYFSSDDISNALLPMFGSPSLNELADAVYELTYALGTPTFSMEQMYGQNEPVKMEHGGYSANSLWTGKLPLKNDEEGKKARVALVEKFLSSIIQGKPDAESVSKWLESCLPEGYEIPKLTLPDADEAAAFVSSYFLKINNRSRDADYRNYLSGNHHMPYSWNGKAIQSEYLSHITWDGATYYESDHLLGGSYLSVDFFLPKDKEASPNSILSEVMEQAYARKHAAFYEINVPYFTIADQHIDLLEEVYAPYCSKRVGVMEKVFQYEMELMDVSQHSKVNLDYEGFSSSSVTISYMVPTSAQSGESFHLDVDRPFVFQSKKVLKMDNEHYAELPTCIGLVYDPAYQAR
ncbi:MAG: hypothetical protein SPL80_03860 [Bacilli bacterium]|nr:hypothetical protein [Bacilli bacterium]